jgi:hypothetical protein
MRTVRGLNYSGLTLRVLLFLTLSLVYLFTGSLTSGQAQTLEQGITEIAERLTATPGIRGQAVAVGDFEQGRRRFSRLSSYVSDLLEVALVNRQGMSGFTVIKRDTRTEAEKEARFGLSDVASSQQRRQIGDLLSATALAAGSLNDLQTHVTIIAQLVDLGSTAILSGHSVRVQKDAALRPMMADMLADKMESAAPVFVTQQPGQVFRPEEQGGVQLRVRIWTDKPSYRLGEAIRFSFAANRNAYVTLINHGTSGNSTIIFPNALSRGNFVQGGVAYSIPGSNDSFSFQIRPPVGMELVRIIATDTPWSPSFPIAPQGGGTFRSLEPVEQKTLTRDIGVMQKERPPTQRAEEIVRIEVRE